jgi:outer membrane protein OmpA-like peptidoglycan-associated protein
MNRASKRARNHARAHAQTGLELVTKMMVIAIVAAVVAGVLWAQTPQNQVELEDRIEQLTAELDQARQKVDDLRRSGRIAELQEMRKPPLIVLPNDTFRFASGKAELSWDFEDRLRDLVPQIRQNQQDFRANTLFVIGHTDTVPMGGNGCTSDEQLIAYANSERSTFNSCSNLELAMARAVAVSKFLQNQGLQGLTIVPLSAGNLYGEGWQIHPYQSGNADPSLRQVRLFFSRLGT